MENLSGLVSRIIYQNEINGWSVIALTDDSGDELVATGTMPLCTPGERVELEGFFVEDKKYGPQFKAISYKTIAPATLSALENYLGSGLIKGVGAATAKKIVQTFGMDTLNTIEHDPAKLAKISGIGKSRAVVIASSFAAQKSNRETIMTLQSYDISVRQSLKLMHIYGLDCLSAIEENPYRMIEDVDGIGFKTADRIAQNMGIEFTSRRRLRAGLSYTLQYGREIGHTYAPRDVLITEAMKHLGLDHDMRDLVDDALLSLIMDGTLYCDTLDEFDRIYLPSFYYMETNAAKKLCLLKQAPVDDATLDLERELNSLEKELKISLADEQRKAVLSALTEGVMVITGGPGTGKTTILQFVLHILTRLGLDFALCAPTGRAAKRMTEATGFDASTIHRLLEYTGEGMLFNKNEDDPLLYDMLIVDEMSMVDLPLFYALLKALPEGTRLVMVGDADQLPPVGPGTVLNDIIKSGVVTVIRLTEIYRQAGRSGIARNARRINLGQEPVQEPDSDFMFLYCPASQAAIDSVLSICLGRDPICSFTDPYRDLQVLAPMKKGSVGVKALNVKLQQALNPPSKNKAQHEYMETIFREGDKVMQVKNDYRMEWTRMEGGVPVNGTGVYNGDLGTIYHIDVDEQTVKVLFDDERLSVYQYAQLEELDLAYCMSIHKAQGSEFPIVILPLITGAPMLMTRNLLYTAVTRARAQVIIIGDWNAVIQMVNNKTMRTRYSALDARLSDARLLT